MPRGAPDYSNVKAYGPLHRLDDQAELASRLGSPVIYDRGGNVVWYMTFQHGLQGVTCGISDAECDYQIVYSPSHLGGFSLRMDPSDEADSYVEYSRVIQFIQTGKISAEAIISMDDSPDQIELMVIYYTSTQTKTGRLRYDPQTGNWSVQSTEGAWITIRENYKLQTGPHTWHSIKLVIDLENDTYVRAGMSRYVDVISEHPLKVVTNGQLGQLNVRVNIGGGAANHAPAYLDALIVMQGEP